MRKFDFSLQRLLDYKEILLKEEISKIQHINKQIADCNENIQKLSEREDYLLHYLNSNKVCSIDVFVSYNRYINDLRSLRASFLKQKKGFEKNLEITKQKATNLQKEHKTILSLKDKKFDEYKKEMSIKEQLEIDDLVLSRRA